MDEKNLVRTVTGQIKWFDPARGFGFVVSDEGGPDILLHANVLRVFGQSTVADAAGISLTIQETDRGIQAVEVLSIEPPAISVGPPLEDLEHLEDADLNTPLEPARVKWFDKGKGFGFANVFGSGEDIFVHVEVLRRSGLADLMPGEAVALRVIDGRRGRMAAQVIAWDVAARTADNQIEVEPEVDDATILQTNNA
ncbi:cold-shock protein [Pacificibacter marinus]|uniref:Cold shock-like protein CspD n=1 Tax=Pacificibacter marinus TaxID=658057 RepID=A0A1Y5SZ09_9RHOB|nr:cold shock domain-containing protein [Pacificibacter marinus]SEK86246.1 cold-shock DNA-binding protein family [Pacificibacter marinus]SLN50153.1 Cold shock-like protein CspD [Pacificibacter marinus]